MLLMCMHRGTGFGECRAIETPDGLFEALPSDLIRQIIVKAC